MKTVAILCLVLAVGCTALGKRSDWVTVAEAFTQDGTYTALANALTAAGLSPEIKGGFSTSTATIVVTHEQFATARKALVARVKERRFSAVIRRQWDYPIYEFYVNGELQKVTEVDWFKTNSPQGMFNEP